VILYTSGTTGKPKGAELTHDNLYQNCTIAADTLGEMTEEDTLPRALPLYHSYGSDVHAKRGDLQGHAPGR
jgi:long-chain acyl-CoA synthetase